MLNNVRHLLLQRYKVLFVRATCHLLINSDDDDEEMVAVCLRLESSLQLTHDERRKTFITQVSDFPLISLRGVTPTTTETGNREDSFMTQLDSMQLLMLSLDVLLSK